MPADTDMLGLLERNAPEGPVAPETALTGDRDMLGLLEAHEPPAPVQLPSAENAPATTYGMPDEFARGATLGTFDRALAYARSLRSGLPYETELSHLDIERQKYAEANPLKASLAEGVGSLAPIVPAAGLAGRGIAGATEAAPWLLRKAAQWMGEGAVAGAVGYPISDYPDMNHAVAAGTLAGLVGGPVGELIARPFIAAVTPEIAALAKRFLAAGNKLYPGQIPGAAMASRFLGTTPSEAQLGDLTRNVARTFGADASEITPELVDQSLRKAGDLIEQGAKNASIPWADPVLRTGIRDVYNDALKAFGGNIDDPAYKRFTALYDQIAKSAKTGTISGDAFHSLTKKNSPLDLAMSRASPVRPFAIQLKGLLMDALARSSPNASQDILAGRHMWHNALIADSAVGKDFQIDPAKLSRAVEGRSGYGSFTKASAKAGEISGSPFGDIGTLAQGAGTFLTGKSHGLPGYFAAHPGGVGLAGIMGLEGVHELAPLERLIPEHMAPLALGAAGLYGLGATALSRPAYNHLLLNGIDLGRAGALSAIPAAQNLYFGGQGQ